MLCTKQCSGRWWARSGGVPVISPRQPWLDNSWFPCVLRAGNSGSRRDAEEVLYHLLPKGMTVFAFDFAVRPRSARYSAMTAELLLSAEG